jgi:hypothetical protein
MSTVKKHVRACQRCGCTEARACADGCMWVLGTDVCDRCLSDEENGLWMLASLMRGDAADATRLAGCLNLRAQVIENLLCLMLKAKKWRRR